jgi:hypothetical protein
MKKASYALAIVAACCLASSLRAQAPAQSCPSTKTINDLIVAIDDAVSGPADKDRTCMRELFVADARLIPILKGPDGNLAPKTLTLDDWIAHVKQRGSTAFYERQVKYTSDVYGHMAHLWSTYEIRPTPDGKASARGINSIQAVHDGGQWKVVQILWEAESPAEPVPPQYLPKDHD